MQSNSDSVFEESTSVGPESTQAARYCSSWSSNDDFVRAHTYYTILVFWNRSDLFGSPIFLDVYRPSLSSHNLDKNI